MAVTSRFGRGVDTWKPIAYADRADDHRAPPHPPPSLPPRAAGSEL